MLVAFYALLGREHNTLQIYVLFGKNVASLVTMVSLHFLQYSILLSLLPFCVTIKVTHLFIYWNCAASHVVESFG